MSFVCVYIYNKIIKKNSKKIQDFQIFPKKKKKEKEKKREIFSNEKKSLD